MTPADVRAAAVDRALIVGVRERGVAVDRAAELAGCAPATLDGIVERPRREKED